MRKISAKQEAAVAKALGGVRTSNSGATPFTKGDVIVDNILIECKTKAKPTQSISIRKEWIESLEEERRGMRKEAAVLALSFGDGKNFYLINESLMKRLAKEINCEQ